MQRDRCFCVFNNVMRRQKLEYLFAHNQKKTKVSFVGREIQIPIGQKTMKGRIYGLLSRPFLYLTRLFFLFRTSFKVTSNFTSFSFWV